MLPCLIFYNESFLEETPCTGNNLCDIKYQTITGLVVRKVKKSF